MGTLAGKTVTLTVNRGGNESEMLMTVGSRTVKGFELVDLPQITRDQTRVREGRLKR